MPECHSECYVEYFNLFPDITHKLNSFSDVSDGLLLGELLRSMSYFIMLGNLQEHPKTFSHRFSNLKILLRSLEQFWLQMLGQEMQCQEIDLVDIAHQARDEEIEKLLQLFVRTAVQAENKWYFIQVILRASEHTQAYLKCIVQKSIGQQSVESPRKEKEKRMYDKIIELDHENDKLQELVSTICNEKLELEQRNAALAEKIEIRQKDIKKLAEMFQEKNGIVTPEKKEGNSVGMDTTEKEHLRIEELKRKILMMSKEHELELEGYRVEIGSLQHEAERAKRLQSQMQIYSEQIAGFDELNQKCKEQQTQLNKQKKLLQEKNAETEVLSAKVKKLQQKVAVQQGMQIQLSLQIERKKAELSQLHSSRPNSQLQSVDTKYEGNSSTLFADCSYLIERQNESLLESNKALRVELDRALRRIRIAEEELQKRTKEISQHPSLQSQNKRLIEQISDMSANHGEENAILLGALFELRKVMGSNHGFGSSWHKTLNPVHSSLGVTRMLTFDSRTDN